ncbi:MAG TPA: IS66 family transposase [Bacteroidia bacterium]|nr:IS66 family transposase [Bacteroidia bacterium]
MSMQESFFSKSIQQENESLKNEILFLKEKNKVLEHQANWLTEQLNSLRREKFGKKSEKWESEEQMTFNEVEDLSVKPDPMGEDAVLAEETTTVEGHERKRGCRRPLPESLPREIIKIELPQEEQMTEDGSVLKVIGWEKSEKLRYEPSKMTVVEIHRAKYGIDSGDYVKTASPIPSVIPKGIATPELLAAIIVSKYADGLPLYRMESIFERKGIDLTRGTMARWLIQVAQALQPIWNILADKLMDSFYVACDETHVQVLKENGRAAEDKSWMWVRATPYGERKIVLFDYGTTRNGKVAQDLMAGYQGYFQCDGLNVYDQLESDALIRLGCGMHARRRFEDAAVSGATSGKSLGKLGLEYFQKLYKLEEEIRERSAEERYLIRKQQAIPIWEEMRIWAEKNKNKVPIKSKIGNAFSYLLSEYEYLIAYLQDGRLEIDNGFTERAIRKYAIGRNNWIFSDTPAGADASAVLYSFVITAKINGVNPYKALVQLCKDIPLAQNLQDYERLADIILTPHL